MNHLARRLGALGLCLLALTAAGCATTVDETRPGGAEATIAPSERSTPPSYEIPASTSGRLTRVLELTSGLGNRVVEGGGSSAQAEILALWEAARPDVQRNEPQSVVRMDDQFALIAKAVRFKRAADADKAARFLGLLFDEYLADHPS